MEETLWPGGPTQTEVDKIKADLTEKGYPADLFEVTAGPVRCITRVIPRIEFNEIGKATFNAATQKKLGETEANDAFNIALLQAALVWTPEGFTVEDPKATPAGVIPTLIEKVMACSGFDEQPPRRI
jgi:hypothetical protein